MHELGYTRDIINTAVEVARQNDATEVKKVCVTIGELRDIVDELFRSCFDHFTKGTAADGADLEIDRIPFTVRCDECGFEYSFPIKSDSPTSCPRCGHDHYHVNTGMEFYINRLEVA
jgi:hydrogenase nickel incorporation protein HypA/HybF